MRKYIEVEKNSENVTHLKVELRYSLGGYNNFTSETEKCGYYLSVNPIEIRKHDDGRTSERYTIFSGVKRCIKEVGRKNAKAEAEAEALAPKIVAGLINYVCEKNNLQVKIEEEVIPLF